jgi:polyisoprenoid-binding protein YceI
MKTSLAGFTFAAALLAAPAFAAPEAFDLDATHTYPNFEISHFGFSTMHGQFTSTSGTLTLDTAAKKASVTATIDAKSVSTGFGKRDDHLRSKEFFNVEQFPALTFKADNFYWDGVKPAQVAGSLTLLGVTKPVTLTVQPTRCDVRVTDKAYTCGAQITATVNRSDFGMKAYLPYIGDEVKIQIEVEATRKTAG